MQGSARRAALGDTRRGRPGCALVAAPGASVHGPTSVNPIMKGTLFVIALVVIGGALFWLVANSRAATETPAYTLLRADGAFELRDYPALTLATTPMRERARNDGFGRLFRYIAGRNKTQAKIAMTAPVLIDRSEDAASMSFILPKETVASGAPAPAGDDVKLAKVRATRFAALRFPGGQSTENEQAALEKLRAWLREQKLDATGTPRFAYYDPPWTPTALRRNEVLIPLPSP